MRRCWSRELPPSSRVRSGHNAASWPHLGDLQSVCCKRRYPHPVRVSFPSWGQLVDNIGDHRKVFVGTILVARDLPCSYPSRLVILGVRKQAKNSPYIVVDVFCDELMIPLLLH